jgi:aspartyl-tRNA(Asn)/glutamyl-tRNA(Gln) amidotransferase subunit A
VFAVLKGKDPGDAMTVDAPFKVAFTRVRERVADFKVGYISEDYGKWGEPDVAGAFAEALDTFRGFGVNPEEVKLPDHAYEIIAGTIIAAEQASAFEALVRDGKVNDIIDPDRRGELIGGQLITAVDYLRCQRIRTVIANDFAGIFGRYDIILGSSTLQCAPPISADMKTIFAGGNSIEAAENLLGLPAISVPCGFDRRKLPVGLKIIGRSFAEADVLAMAHLYQTVTRWHERRPRI